MLSGISRLLIPRISRGAAANLKYSHNYEGTTNAKDIESVKQVEDELFGRYYGATDSSDLSRRFKSDFRKNKRRTSTTTSSSKLNKVDTPNTWGVTKLTLHDPMFSKLIMDARMKRMKKQQKMIVEGKRLIKDALEAGQRPQFMFVTEIDMLENLEDYRKDLEGSCSFFKVAKKDLFTWSSLTTPPGMMAIFERPKDIAPPVNCLPITVICDNIREPNNLGSIFRVCAALPCQQVLVMKGCADPWEAKSLRGGSGGQFHIPIEYPVNWQDISEVSNISQAEIFLADNNNKHQKLQVRSIDDQLLSGPRTSRNIFIVIGGETHGISDDAHEFAKSFERGSIVNIPMAMESINSVSALAIILYEFRRQFNKLDLE